MEYIYILSRSIEASSIGRKYRPVCFSTSRNGVGQSCQIQGTTIWCFQSNQLFQPTVVPPMFVQSCQPQYRRVWWRAHSLWITMETSTPSPPHRSLVALCRLGVHASPSALLSSPPPRCKWIHHRVAFNRIPGVANNVHHDDHRIVLISGWKYIRGFVRVAILRGEEGGVRSKRKRERESLYNKSKKVVKVASEKWVVFGKEWLNRSSKDLGWIQWDRNLY